MDMTHKITALLSAHCHTGRGKGLSECLAFT